MTDKHITVDTIRWHSVLPWLHLLRALPLSVRVRQVLLAVAAMLVLSWGWRFLTPTVLPEARPIQLAIWSADLPVTSLQLQAPSFWKQPLIWMAMPEESVTVPASQLFRLGNSWSNVAAAWTDLLWSLVVWAIFGGAIARLAAVRFARDESVSIRMALKFSVRNWQCYVYGPLLPMLAVGLLAVVGGSVGWLHRWWGSGSAILKYLGFLPTFCGLGMALLLLLTACSWPLMVVAISTEGSDGFDGLSRAFGYVMNRLWYFAFLVVLAFLAGSVTYWAAYHVGDLTIRLAAWSSGVTPNTHFHIWRMMANSLVAAVGVSYFWSATTVIYFLLRQSDDGTPLDQVYIPGPPPKPEPLPLVGVAASQQPVIERPATDPSDSVNASKENA